MRLGIETKAGYVTPVEVEVTHITMPVIDVSIRGRDPRGKRFEVDLSPEDMKELVKFYAAMGLKESIQTWLDELSSQLD